MKKVLILFLFLFSIIQSGICASETEAIYQVTRAGKLDDIYPQLYKALEASGFYVIFEANIGKNLSRNAEKWGEDYNRNNFTGVKSMVICNPYYANQVLNLDPKLMALCPLTVTVLEKDANTTVLFERLTPIAAGSPAEDILWEVETTILSAIDSVMKP